jgi:hypothetical protein
MNEPTELVTCPRCKERMTAVKGRPSMVKCVCGVSCTIDTARNEERMRQLAKLHAAQEAVPNKVEAAALARVFSRAAGCSGGETRLRKLLFAWHNAVELGGFDLTDLWSLSDEWRADALTVIGMIARGPQGWYPSHYGYEADMMALIETFGPEQSK